MKNVESEKTGPNYLQMRSFVVFCQILAVKGFVILALLGSWLRDSREQKKKGKSKRKTRSFTVLETLRIVLRLKFVIFHEKNRILM